MKSSDIKVKFDCIASPPDGPHGSTTFPVGKVSPRQTSSSPNVMEYVPGPLSFASWESLRKYARFDDWGSHRDREKGQDLIN